MTKYLGLLFVSILVAATEVTRLKAQEQQPQVPCYFIFGDSMFDNGNNNNLKNGVKANYPPYGVDFPGKVPTGRFSNGRIIPDFIAKFLGLKDPIPPFASVVGASSILKGVNYASGGAGIRNESGQNLGERISLSKQLQNYETTVGHIRQLLKNNTSEVQKHLNKCLYTINIGSNDYLNNYFMDESYNTSRTYNPDRFADSLIEIYSGHLNTLYKHGARRIALFGVGPIGCVKRIVMANRIRKASGVSPCIDDINNAVQLFNKKLYELVNELNSSLHGAKFTYIDMYGDPSKSTPSGRKIASCCEVEKGDELCIPDKLPCPNRSATMLWDDVHSTEDVNLYVAMKAYNGTSPGGPYKTYNITNLF